MTDLEDSPLGQPSESFDQPADQGARRPDEALAAAVRRLINIAALDPVLRDGLVAFAKIVLDELSQPAIETLPRVPEEPVEMPSEPASTELAPLEPSPVPTEDQAIKSPEDIVPIGREALLALIDEVLPAQSSGPAPYRTPSIPAEPTPTIAERDWALPGLRDRLRAKAELTASVTSATAQQTAVDEDLIHRARSVGATTWMTQLADPDPARLQDLEASFRASAEAVDLVSRLRTEAADRSVQTAAVKTLAAAQSALRVSVERLRSQADEDQAGVFGWLKTTTYDERLFIDRHMRIDDALDPAELDRVMQQTREALAEMEAEEEREEARSKRLGQLRYHVKRIVDGRGSGHDQQKAIEAAAGLIEGGLPPSNLELRELLIPVLEQLRPGVERSRAFALIVREIDRHLEEQEHALRQEPSERESDPDLERVADLVEGTTMVIVGGEIRVDHRAALLDAFRLKDIVWLTLSDDPTLAELRTAIARPEVVLVLQLIRWARHRHGEAADIAREYGKEFVRIPGGINPRAVAAEIWDQASDALMLRSGHSEGGG